MAVVIGCDSFLALRNVRNGNLGERLAGSRVVALVDPHQYAGAVQTAPSGVEIGCLLEFDPRRDPPLYRLMERTYYARKCYYDPATQWQDFRKSSTTANLTNPLRRRASLARAAMRMAGYWAAGRLGQAQAGRRALMAALSAHPIMADYERLLRDLDARVVVSFSQDGWREMALMAAARRLSIPTILMIRSRDNLAAKIMHLPDADAYLVWAETTREFLCHMYPELRGKPIHVTGSPQFDRHLNPAYRLSRDAFFQHVGLDPARPLIVYTTATPGLIRHEIHIVQHLADALRDGTFVRGAQMLVRGHPRGFGANVPLLHHTYPGVAIYPPPTSYPVNSPEHEANVIRLILEDEPLHLATLAYQDVQVNISGTMFVDSAILDKPSVGIYYDLPAETPAGLSARRYYDRSDMRPIVASGGVRLAHTPDQAIAQINAYLENPSLDAAGRRTIREREAGRLDGSAGERIARIIGSYL
ncbi:MAG TPA: hypothetical protein PLD47_14250 [Aggregatilineales bacterium]|nr:hypothetical protein [Anaerolineales bacterium]HRE48884.1 hypothetical protein [Aggregatilineales bacterium]